MGKNWVNRQSIFGGLVKKEFYQFVGGRKGLRDGFFAEAISP